jgi:fructokinase
MLVGSVEAGGTKFVCGVGTGPDDLRQVYRFPTGEPTETLEKAMDFFREQRRRHGELHGVGVGCFGPVDLQSGTITSTPKKGWQGVGVRRTLEETLGVPVAFDTDVNVAALGEWRWGAAKSTDTMIYLTIGTGIGGGGMSGGKLLHGLVHPEMGHMRIPHDLRRDPYPGSCPFHGDCWEGLASGPAIEDRWGESGEDLSEEHEAWELEADYIASALMSLICVLSPERIVLGGGVMHRSHLFPLVRKKVAGLLAGYIRSPALVGDGLESYIVPPALGDRAGVLGGIALAQRCLGG